MRNALRCATSPRRPAVPAITPGASFLELPSWALAYYNSATAVEPESLTTPRPVDPDSAPESALELFYQRPILNSPYVRPDCHWELDKDNRPTNRIVESRRPSSYVSPIPAARKSSDKQLALVPDDVAKAVQTSDQQYDLTEFINGIRRAVDQITGELNPSVIGASRRKPRGCSGIGDTIASPTFGRSSVRSRPSRR